MMTMFGAVDQEVFTQGKHMPYIKVISDSVCCKIYNKCSFFLIYYLADGRKDIGITIWNSLSSKVLF